MEVADTIQLVPSMQKHNLHIIIFFMHFIFQLYEYLVVINSFVVDLIIQKLITR